MKKSELRKLIVEYEKIKLKSKDIKLRDKLDQIEHKYYHETAER